MSDRTPTESAFRSILFDRVQDEDSSRSEPPFFGDLHLDQILAAVTEGRDEYNLAPLFYRPLHGVGAILYRHQALRDLEQDDVLAVVKEFAQRMRRMRDHLALVKKLHYGRQKQRWLMEAVAVYCSAAGWLSERLDGLKLSSPAFEGLREYMSNYIGSTAFTALVGETRELEAELSAIRYVVHIKGNRVRVAAYEGEPDMSEEVERTFAKFKESGVKDHRLRFREGVDMNHLEAQILECVAKLYPETFSKLEAYCARHRGYLDETIRRFDREIQFYLAYFEYIAPLKASGLAFCYPRVSGRSKEVHATETFDLALAAKLIGQTETVVCNDFNLTGPERILVVSGPNNGGKTTFARTFGQLHYLASLGLPVPGRDARLFLPDRIFTHFEREEDIQTLRGKFEDELFRIHGILGQATGRSVLVMNESFGSTTLRDALLVGTEVVKQIIDLDVLCVFVTFVDELASLGESTVSMMSTVSPQDPAVRTFKVVRKPADGLAYAAAIADKYGLTYEALTARIAK